MTNGGSEDAADAFGKGGASEAHVFGRDRSDESIREPYAGSCGCVLATDAEGIMVQRRSLHRAEDTYYAYRKVALSVDM